MEDPAAEKRTPPWMEDPAAADESFEIEKRPPPWREVEKEDLAEKQVHPWQEHAVSKQT